MIYIFGSIILKIQINTRAEKNSIGNQSRPESRSARKESRIGSDPLLFILLKFIHDQ